jgi:hypothetical protein
VTTDNKILEKIKKLLALSESPNEHEAASALAKAQALMAEHDVSSMHIQLADMVSGSVRSRTSARRPRDWEMALFRIITLAFGCELAWSNGEDKALGEYKIIGAKHRVAMAEYAASTLGRRLVQARAKYVADLPDYFSRSHVTELANGFCRGWVIALHSKVTALALGADEQKARETFIHQRIGDNPKYATMGKTKYSDTGLQHGFEQGEKESIHRPMTGDSAEQLKIGS